MGVTIFTNSNLCIFIRLRVGHVGQYPCIDNSASTWTMFPAESTFTPNRSGGSPPPFGVATKANPSKDDDAKLSGLMHARRVTLAGPPSETG